MPMRIVLDMDDDIVALVTRKHTESRMLPSLWKAVSVSNFHEGIGIACHPKYVKNLNLKLQYRSGSCQIKRNVICVKAL